MGSQLLDGSFTVHTVVGLVVSHTVLFVQQVCCLVRQTVVQLRKSQFDFSVFTVRGLRSFVHPRCHQGILVLLSRDLLRAQKEGTERAGHTCASLTGRPRKMRNPPFPDGHTSTPVHPASTPLVQPPRTLQEHSAPAAWRRLHRQGGSTGLCDHRAACRRGFTPGQRF